MSSAGVLTIPTDPGATAAIRPALPGVTDERLAASFDHCRHVVKTRARNFYYGLRLTPEPRRGAVYAIYAWMRFGDDCVDEAQTTQQKREQLRLFRETTDRVLGGDLDDDLAPFWLAFAATMRSYPIDPALIRATIEGLEEDLTPQPYAMIDDLEAYCYRVASTVGLICVSIWGFRPGCTADDVRAGHEMARRRGLAFQLTNILRDFAEDFDASPSRVYLPARAFTDAGVTPADLRRWSDPDRCTRLVRTLAARAREHYLASSPLDALIDPPCRSTLWAMTRIYAGLLDRIEVDPRRIVLGKRVRLSSLNKACIAASAWARGRFNLWPRKTGA